MPLMAPSIRVFARADAVHKGLPSPCWLLAGNAEMQKDMKTVTLPGIIQE